MIRLTHALVLTAAATTTSAAGANSLPAAILWLTSEVRGELAVLEGQAAHLLADCRDYRDVKNEIEDLCRDLDRLERELNRPIRHRHQLERLARLAQRVDDEACDLQEEVCEAIDGLLADRRFGRRTTAVIPHRGRQVAFASPRSGFTLRIGGSSSLFDFRSGRPGFGRVPVGHTVSHAPPRHVVAGPQPGELRQLRVQADRLRLLTKQLAGILCG